MRVCQLTDCWEFLSLGFLKKTARARGTLLYEKRCACCDCLKNFRVSFDDLVFGNQRGAVNFIASICANL